MQKRVACLKGVVRVQGAELGRSMTELNFICTKCRKEFDCDVGKISFPVEENRPRFEKDIVCPRCGVLSMDDVELTELGQTQLGAVFFA